MATIGLASLVALLSSIATYIVFTTVWFHLYGRPQLASWWGVSSKAAVARAREEFAAKVNAIERVALPGQIPEG